MTDLVIFGDGMVADIVAGCIRRHGRDRILGFTVHREHLRRDSRDGLPVVAFDEVERHFPQDQTQMLVAVGYQDMNIFRAATCAQAREKGYRLASYVGGGTYDGVGVGENVFVMDGNSLQPGVTVGDGSFVFSGAVVGHHTTVGAWCWITSGSVVGGASSIGDYCFLGLGCTVGHRVAVGANCFLGAGARVTRDAAPNGVYLEQDSERFRLDTSRFLRITKLS